MLLRGKVMPKDSRTKMFYQLDCGHVVLEYNIMMQGTSFYCYECEGVIPVADVLVYEWRAKCDTCKFSRWAGQSSDVAKWKAISHQNIMRHAVVVVYEENPRSARERRRLERVGAIS